MHTFWHLENIDVTHILCPNKLGSKERMRIMGFVPATSTPEEHDKIVRSEIETFIKVAKLVGLRAP